MPRWPKPGDPSPAEIRHRKAAKLREQNERAKAARFLEAQMEADEKERAKALARKCRFYGDLKPRYGR